MINIVLAIYAVMSLITFGVYGWDKRCAGRGKWRTPEKALHLLSLLGGWPGAVVGQQLFKHKRRKLWFMSVTVFIVILHVAAWVYVCTRPGFALH